MPAFDDLSFVTAESPLAQATGLGVGGPAQWLAAPRDFAELETLVKRCAAEDVPYRVLGGGHNVLIPDEGVRGVVVQLTEPAFRQLRVEGKTVRAGAGAELADLIAASCKASLSGLEVLAGIPGSVGGAVVCNAGTRAGDIGQFVHSIDLLDVNGRSTRSRGDLRFSYRSCSLDDAIILEVVFELVPDKADDLGRRLKKVWISRRAQQPFGLQRSACVFSNPRGLSAEELIEKSGVRGSRVGGAELCDRDVCYVLAHDGATSRDVRRLIDLVRSRVQERTGVHLDLQMDLW